MELTLLRRFLRAANAEDCGRSIKMPYMHLYKYGYFSGSNSCRRRSAQLVSLPTIMYVMGKHTGKDW